MNCALPPINHRDKLKEEEEEEEEKQGGSWSCRGETARLISGDRGNNAGASEVRVYPCTGTNHILVI